MARSSPTRRAPPWAPPITLLPAAIREPRSAWRSILVGWLTTFLPSLVLGTIVTKLLPNVTQPQLPISNWVGVFLMVVFAPVTETLIMVAVLAVLLRFLPPTVAVIVSAIAWGIAHSLAAPSWGLVIWWPFLIFSTLFVTWRQRSLALAFGMPMLAHALHNLPSALLVAYFPHLISQ